MTSLTRSRPHRSALALAILAVVLSGALGACGGDDEAATTTTEEPTATTDATEAPDPAAERIGQKVANSDDLDGVTSEMQACVGERFLEDYDEAEALAVAEQIDENTDALTEDQKVVLVEALDECIDGVTYATSFLGALWAEIGLTDGPDDDAVQCLAEVVDGRVGTLSLETDEAGTLPEDFSASLDECIPAEVVGAIVAVGLSEPSEDGSTLGQDQIDCVAEQVQSELTFSQLAERDPAASEAIRTALEQCPAG